jgi:uncharacterized membrane protein HdeD (DUF308 family)
MEGRAKEFRVERKKQVILLLILGAISVFLGLSMMAYEYFAFDRSLTIIPAIFLVVGVWSLSGYLWLTRK